MASAEVSLQRSAVVDRYSMIARRALAGEELGAGSAGAILCGLEDSSTKDLPHGAAGSSLGCGNPLARAVLRPGETVVDIGSGGGTDALRSARAVGDKGKVIGLDASTDMIELARRHAREAGASNVEFVRGDMEDVPLPDGIADVVISNCVLNLSLDKETALAEAARLLRPGGRLSVSDVVADEGLDAVAKAEAEARLGCSAGTVTVAEYCEHLVGAGFVDVAIRIVAEIEAGLWSATVQGTRPEAPPGTVIRPMRPTDADQVMHIYQVGLDTGNASFETVTPDWVAFDAGKLPLQRHVAVDSASGHVVGWVAAGRVSARPVYSGVAEHSVYVHPDHQGRGIARALLRALIGSTESAGMWTLQTGIFPENAASLRAHLAVGFAVLGTRRQIGRHYGKWRDVLYLERRSAVVV